MKITIHRALAELKLIDSKIDKALLSFNPTGLHRENGKINETETVREFEDNAIAKYQSIQDNIKRKQDIKSAIVKANAVTMVKIGDKEMTISDAITFKQIVGVKRKLADRLLSQYTQTLAKVEQSNSVIDANALKLAEAALQKDNINMNDSDVVAITEPYLKKNTYHFNDVLKAKSKQEIIIEEVELFETEVDAVLSEINATTLIEI